MAEMILDVALRILDLWWIESYAVTFVRCARMSGVIICKNVF